jgi:signal transduction histidine kinase
MLGPITFVLSGGSEWIVGRLWTAGLIPICLSSLGWALWVCWHRRTIELMTMTGAITLTIAAGLHDFMVHTTAPLLQAIAPQLAANRLFMLHYAADLMLLVMGGILCARFISTLDSLSLLNRTLESRVAQREQSLMEKYAQVGQLERRLAADEERQRITRDLHDGLGSQLFVTLSRLESGHIGHQETVQALRECIADMRLTLDAMSPEDNDFLMAWGNFRFRWERQLSAAGIESIWRVEPKDALIELVPQIGLQLLRISQEALTNVMKHADANVVVVLLERHASAVRIEISDNGKGLSAAGHAPGQGLLNMQARAQRLRATFGMDAMNPGTRVWVEYAMDKDATAGKRTANAV